MFNLKEILKQIKDTTKRIKKLELNIQTGKEVETGKLIDGKPEYVIKADFGSLPNNTVKSINTGLQNSNTYSRINGIARKSDGTRYWVIPNEHIKLDFENGWITVTTHEDLSMFNATFEIYYTK